jgi:hypothetical protein
MSLTMKNLTPDSISTIPSPAFGRESVVVLEGNETKEFTSFNFCVLNILIHALHTGTAEVSGDFNSTDEQLKYVCSQYNNINNTEKD